MVLEIALGIVLAVLIIWVLPWIMAIGAVALVVGLVALIVVVVVVVAWKNPELLIVFGAGISVIGFYYLAKSLVRVLFRDMAAAGGIRMWFRDTTVRLTPTFTVTQQVRKDKKLIDINNRRINYARSREQQRRQREQQRNDRRINHARSRDQQHRQREQQRRQFEESIRKHYHQKLVERLQPLQTAFAPFEVVNWSFDDKDIKVIVGHDVALTEYRIAAKAKCYSKWLRSISYWVHERYGPYGSPVSSHFRTPNKAIRFLKKKLRHDVRNLSRASTRVEGGG